MDDGSDQQDELPDRTLRRRPLVPRSLGHSLSQSGSILDVLKRPSHRNSTGQELPQAVEQGTSQRGTFKALTHRSAMSSEVPNRRSVIVQEHQLMKPLQPPIPKSKTLGSLESDLLYTTPETSPPRSLRSSIGPSVPKSPGYAQEIRRTQPPEELAKSSTTQRPAVGLSDGAGTELHVDNPTSPSLTSNHGGPFNLSIGTSSLLARRRTLDPSQISNMANRVSSLDTSGRSTQSPTLIPQPRFARKVSARKYSPSLDEEIPPVPPIPASLRARGRIATPGAALTPRSFSTRVVSTPPGRNSWIPTPVNRPRYVSTPNVGPSKLSTPTSNSPKSPATRIPTPVKLLPRHPSSYALRSKSRFYPYSNTSVRRYSPRPDYDASKIKLPGTIYNPRVTPPSAKTQHSVSSVSSRATAIDHISASSPTPNVGRKGNENVSDALSVRRRSKSPATSKVNLSKPTIDPVAIAARREAELNEHIGIVDEAMPPIYWLGRYMGKSDRLRTQELNVKAAIAAAGDPGRADHPANTGMFNDDIRERYVMEYLTASCGNQEALDSLQAFQNERQGKKKGPAPAKKTPEVVEAASEAGPSKTKKSGTAPVKTGFFEKLRKKSKTFKG